MIRTTGEHPFYAEDLGWTACRDLRRGQRILSESSATWLTIERIAETDAWETVYNFRVADWHTYFVGGDVWGWALWAHNASYGGRLTAAEKASVKELTSQAVPVRDAIRQVRAARTADAPNSGFRVGRHGDMPTPRGGTESHHGIMSRWMEENFPKYNPDSAPAVLMPLQNHNATRGVYNTWRAEMRKAMGGTFDWSRVSKADMMKLSERMFDAANVPADIRSQYYAQFAELLKTL